jgi:DNA-binding MarR family transcriptional regulator
VHSHIDADRSLGFGLKRLQQVLRARMDATLARHGLTTPQYLVLALLAEHPGISNSELARRSAVAAPTMLRILDALGRAGYVTRAERSPQLRTRGTALTDRGARQLAAAGDDVQRYEDLLLAQAAPEHVPVILSWMRACAEELTARQP